MKNINVKVKKETMQFMSGLFIIILTFVVNGFLSFVSFGFDFTAIKTLSYWANFIVLFISEIAVLFGMFIIQRIKDLKNDKVIDLQKHIDNRREIVYGVDKVADAEEWLREVYNYREKLYLFEDKIKKIYSNIILVEPKENCKGYARKKAKYDKKKEFKEWLLDQLKLVKKDKQRLKDLINKIDKEEYAELENSEVYAFKTAKIKYKEVYWNNLLSDSEEQKSKHSYPFYNEMKELAKNVVRYLAIGIITSGIMSALSLPAFRGWGLSTIVSMLFNAIALFVFMSRGIRLSKKIILGTYVKALESRKAIYNQMLCDLKISQIEIEED
jgi:hypothetical protein